MLGAGRWDISKFWSEDYITGITAFIAQVNDDIVCIEREERFYRWFIDDWASVLIQGLGRKAHDTDLLEHEALCHLLANFKRSLDVEQLDIACLRPLQSMLKQAKRRRDEMEKLLRRLYSDYSRYFKAMREALDMYNRKAALSVMEEAKECNVDKFPIELDECLKFNSEIALGQFLEKVKQSMPRQKKGFMNYLGMEGNSSFQGKQLMDAIKKNSEKLDTSPYNLDRLGQKLLDLNLLREDALAVTSRRLFDQEAYYRWIETANDPSGRNSISGWVKGFSATAVGDLPLEPLKTRYFETCCKLELSRFELEKAIYENFENYSHFATLEIDRTLRKNRQIFNKLYGHDKGEAAVPHSPFLCYLRSSRAPIIKWEPAQDSLTQRTLMLGRDEIDDDALRAISLILTHVQGFADEADLRKRVSKAWRAGSAVEMQRAINLKIELIKTFRDTPDATNLKSVEALIRANRHAVANDWTGLIKLWLLELPNSLIPPRCIETISKHHDDSWLAGMPANNLLVLAEMCQHFRWLGQEFAAFQGPISHYFMRRVDCIHDFPGDCRKLEPWLAAFLTASDSPERLQQASKDNNSRATTPASPSPPAIQVLEPEPTMTPPPADPDHSFKPRPFRTASAASSAPGSPLPSRDSRRISGLVIEAPESN
ncbi:hypothetical protein HG536_0A00780 [Torulaspora globosa]|uniref:Rho-GAP domain-containing protein n=1 Tax=Torulaspora globosa TaxID=48254 RepID=A0A7G3Z9S5_9SACH|nr:uncharacterized protein HG536_0A00780 [Torulaspora globosa]QLL30261.1 hypothetical protein HG536_0A00780 [Torulaspora globosa]